MRHVLAMWAMAALLTPGTTLAAQQGTVTAHRMQFQGIERTYLLYTPQAAQADDALPLVIALHGGGGSGEGFMHYTSFNDYADDDGFFVAYPDAVGARWHDGREIDNLGVDDVGFMAALIDDITSAQPIDEGRIYVTGMSNGGFMAATLACVRPELFAGIAIITASIPQLLLDQCVSSPMPALIMNGTDDPLVPYGGGEVVAGDVVRGVASSTDATVAYWREVNGCDARPDATQTLDSRPLDRTSIEVEWYQDCKSEAPVALFRVVGGGHTLPGAAQYLPRAVIGATSREIDGAAVIMDFFTHGAR